MAGFSRKARLVDPARVGLLDEDFASTVDRCDGGDDLQRLDLRSPASAANSTTVPTPECLKSFNPEPNSLCHGDAGIGLPCQRLPSMLRSLLCHLKKQLCAYPRLP